MKKIIILTDFKGELSIDLKNTIKKIFENYIIIENIYLNNIKENDIIDGDVILFMLENRFEKYSHHIKKKENVIIISRTLKKEQLSKLENLPKSEPILIVNDFYETTLQLTSLLYKTKYKYLKFISYNENEKKDLSSIKYAITPGIKEKVPKEIPNIIDLGIRVLDLFTIISIVNKLELGDNVKIINNILLYNDELIFIKNGIEEHYKELYLKNKELEGLLKNNSDGIILVNDKNKILFFNKRACDFLNINLEINQHFFRIISSNLHINSFENKKNDVIVIKENFYYVLFNQIELYDNQYLLISLKDITELKKMEAIIKEKLISNGFLAKYNFSKIVYKSVLMEECIEKAKIYSKSDNSILITGESGTGKELLAQSIHNNSSRKNFPFIAINCAAIPENLFESELFGYEKGAFTGALFSGKKGLLEKANNGTIFLDEIGDMPISFQVKLLRAIEEKQIMRIAGKENININVRFISATSKNLFKEMSKDKFRIDLFYRLNVLPLIVPPLRKRIEDIVPLFKAFIGNKNLKIPEDIQNVLNHHHWEGNIRELRNVAEYYLLMKDTNSPLPEYLNFKKENFNEEIKLKILKYIKVMGNNIGQNKIFNFLKKDNLTIYKFKQILSELSKENYIKIEIGRKGCSLTDKGLKLIKEE